MHLQSATLLKQSTVYTLQKWIMKLGFRNVQAGKSTATIAGILAIVLTATPHAAARPADSGNVLAKLNLTPAQQTQLRQINARSRSQFEAVLTPQQRQELRAKVMRSGLRRLDLKTAVSLLNLTTEQKSQIEQIQQSSQNQIEAMLTPEQRKKLRQLRGS